MDKIKPEDQLAKSADIVSENIAQLQSLFPEAFVEGKIDFEVLKQLLGGAVEEREEKYGLNWHGKRAARQLALTPSMGTLRPCPEESVDWDTTQNLMIEGDNLEVLKLLQKSYAGKVKLIYIDPPYNTGNDFVYPDNFQDSIRSYQFLIGLRDSEGNKISSDAKNSASSGRFHTDWLNMLYPRIIIAKSLLIESGFIFVSIDDSECSNVRKILDDIFGEENFVAQLVWKSRVSEDTRAKTGISNDHEYIICYSKGCGAVLRGTEKDVDKFSNPDNDPRGPWRSADLTGLATKDARPNLHYNLINPETDINYGCPPKGWRYEKSTMMAKIEEKRILFPVDKDGRPRHKLFLNEMKSMYKNMSSVILSASTANGTREVNALLGTGVFDFPKPVDLMKMIVEQTTDAKDVILDFFAGSGTIGHAIMQKNCEDQAERRFILVQLPEQLDSSNRDQAVASDFCKSLSVSCTLAEITKERLRRAGKKIREQNPMFAGDTGFRVFKLDSSNIRAWNPDRDNLSQSLMDHIEHILPGRTEADILYEVLLKLGLDLCVPMEKRVFAGKDVHAIGGGVLLACLNTNISRDDVEALGLGIVAWHKELAPAGESTVVFRDNGFADDVAKTNLTAILHQNGLTNVRSL